MKKGEKELKFSEELKKRGWREIDSSHRKHLSGKPAKSRISIYLDADVIDRFKSLAEKQHIGYQTLINNHLRQVFDKQYPTKTVQDIKSELLNDRKFLHDLKEALAG
jgi:uncharacterized protein (DUF4415 family)